MQNVSLFIFDAVIVYAVDECSCAIIPIQFSFFFFLDCYKSVTVLSIIRK